MIWLIYLRSVGAFKARALGSSPRRLTTNIKGLQRPHDHCFSSHRTIHRTKGSLIEQDHGFPQLSIPGKHLNDDW